MNIPIHIPSTDCIWSLNHHFWWLNHTFPPSFMLKISIFQHVWCLNHHVFLAKKTIFGHKNLCIALKLGGPVEVRRQSQAEELHGSNALRGSNPDGGFQRILGFSMGFHKSGSTNWLEFRTSITWSFDILCYGKMCTFTSWKWHIFWQFVRSTMKWGIPKNGWLILESPIQTRQLLTIFSMWWSI